MEERLAQLFPDQIVQIKEYHSFVNQPERIQISSQEDINDYDPTTLTSYYNFRVRLPRPALNVKSIQLARATIPNPVASFPDSECVMWYYALPPASPGNIYLNTAGAPGDLTYIFDVYGVIRDAVSNEIIPNSYVYFDSGNIVLSGTNYTFNKTTASAGNVPTEVYDNGDLDYWIEYTSVQVSPILPNYLRYIRLVPSNAQPELMTNFTGGFNRIFSDYDDLVAELNLSTIDDPLNGQAGLNNVVGEFKFVANQVGFSYDARFSKIVFSGLDPFYSYLPVASDDPIWYQAAIELAARDRQNTRFSFSGAIEIVQPYIPFRQLNLRLGFNYATYPQGDNFRQMIRPIPPFIASPPSPGSLGKFTIYDHVAPGYADLVATSCCHLYTDITGGSTVDSIAEKALLATVPLNTQALGVGFHSLPLNNPLTKIATQLYEIYIEMRTDAGQPFYLGNNAIVSLELILTY